MGGREGGREGGGREGGSIGTMYCVMYHEIVEEEMTASPLYPASLKGHADGGATIRQQPLKSIPV